MRTFDPGDLVHVAALGKGVVREVRNGQRYLVEIKGRAVVVGVSQLGPVERARARPGPPSAPAVPLEPGPSAPASLDLHGLTTIEAVEALDSFLSAALLAGHAEVRIIHGRSGGALRAAVRTRLGQLRPVRAFRLDPGNPGVTIVSL